MSALGREALLDPGRGPALHVVDVGGADGGRHFRGDRAALADAAHKDGLLVGPDVLLRLGQDLSQGDQLGVGYVAGGILIRLSHVDHSNATSFHHLARGAYVNSLEGILLLLHAGAPWFLSLKYMLAQAGRDYALAVAAPAWLVRNYGPRCTLVCAASVLRKLGARDESLVDAIAATTRFREASGPPVVAYLGGHSALDRGIELAARRGGLRVRSRTRFVVRWRDVAAWLERDLPVVLNCYRAPSRQWSHSVLAVRHEPASRRLLTLDPNDGRYRWLTWRRPATGWVCTATFIEPLGEW